MPKSAHQKANHSHSFNVSSSASHYSKPAAEVVTDNQAKERLYQLGNKKGISSEDVFGAKEEKTAEAAARYNQLAGAKAISSDMFFYGKDREEEGDDRGGNNSARSGNGDYDQYKEQAK